uniref:PHD-type domain-containing protein n=1 Tax=Echeneis naucrates TaxID=173247 RepID=A0A665VH55_ECHNA
MPVETATNSSESRCPVRRSGRQSKRTDKLEEFLLTAKRGSRRSAPPSLESGDPPSQTPTDAETASEASFDGNADSKTVEDKVDSPERRTRSSTRKQAQKKTQGGRQSRGGSGASVNDEGSSENEEDSRDAAKKDLLQDNNGEREDGKNDQSPDDARITNTAQPQPELDSEKTEVALEKDEHGSISDKVETDKEADEDGTDKSALLLLKRGPLRTYVNKTKAAGKKCAPGKAPANKSAPVKKETKPKAAQTAVKTRKPQMEDDGHNEEDEEDEEEEDDDDDDDDNDSSTSSSSLESDDGGYDPNALYCICRQKHNKRFMICCDRCEEWFHGDCVGITEARGRLMERNGEDYICPNCTAKKNQVVRPATSVLSTSMEANTSGTDSLSAAQTVAAPSPTCLRTEEKAAEDMGIKGRIEKATNPTGKKKIKIFQPKAEDDSSLPKCIGPGCENNAQPGSVYCGNDCILRHAAAAMKSITDVKEPKQKDKSKTQKTRNTTGGKKPQKKNQEESESEEDNSPDLDEDDEDEHAEEHPPPPATASWSSDHNYIAVTPEKTTPISPTVLNKKCMYLFEGLLLKPHCCSSIINVVPVVLT